MSKTRIFVSSTCYDLSAVREALREEIIAIGHEPVLSEYSSFPVLPDLKTIDNCKKAVRENADIFLLIVGGKRGSLDPASGKPIVNLEYQCAEEQNIDAFIFVRKAVLDLMPVWEKNPNADFSPHVDFPEVFAFVKVLREEKRWIFSFDKTGDIKEVLANQLSVFLRDLLSRKRAGKLRHLKVFIEESERAQEIARDKPRFWEYLLTEELLRNKFKEVKNRYAEIEEGRVFQKTRELEVRETWTWMQLKIRDLINLMDFFKKVAEIEIPTAWGKPGEPGDALAIKRSVDKLIQGCNELLDWETDVLFTSVPERIQKLKMLMRGTTKGMIEELSRLPEELGRPFKESAEPKGTITIELAVPESPNFKLLSEEASRINAGINERPWEWVE